MKSSSVSDTLDKFDEFWLENEEVIEPGLAVRVDKIKSFLTQAIEEAKEQKDKEWRETIEGMKKKTKHGDCICDDCYDVNTYNFALSDLLTKEEKL